MVGVFVGSLIVLVPDGPAFGAVHIGPNQHFEALVNGGTGSPSPVVIRMACFGPTFPGATGHPFGGQTVTVRQAIGTGSNDGFTGASATSIRAFFGPPPPLGSGTSTNSVKFRSYGTLPLPTTLVLPCGGSSTVTFVPLPSSSTARDATVRVTYVGQP